MLANPVECVYCENGVVLIEDIGLFKCMDCDGTGQPDCDCPKFDPETSKAQETPK